MILIKCHLKKKKRKTNNNNKPVAEIGHYHKWDKSFLFLSYLVAHINLTRGSTSPLGSTCSWQKVHAQKYCSGKSQPKVPDNRTFFMLIGLKYQYFWKKIKGFGGEAGKWTGNLFVPFKKSWSLVLQQAFASPRFTLKALEWIVIYTNLFKL